MYFYLRLNENIGVGLLALSYFLSIVRVKTIIPDNSNLKISGFGFKNNIVEH